MCGCVCVSMREREKECAYVCECVCVCERVCTFVRYLYLHPSPVSSCFSFIILPFKLPSILLLCTVHSLPLIPFPFFQSHLLTAPIIFSRFFLISSTILSYSLFTSSTHSIIFPAFSSHFLSYSLLPSAIIFIIIYSCTSHFHMSPQSSLNRV